MDGDLHPPGHQARSCCTDQDRSRG
jgi:hypothetical protein